MTKQQIHDALKASGAELKGINAYKVEDLTALYVKQFGKQPGEDANTAPGASQPPGAAPSAAPGAVPPQSANANDPQVRVLFFDGSGWCEELKRSYFQGVHRPADVKEYLALRKFATKEGAPV